MRYEAIKQAAIVMALDNGAINRYRTLVQFLDDLRAALEKEDADNLEAANVWLGTLNYEQIDIFTGGSDEEIDALNSPEFVDDLFNRIFQEVL